MSDTSINLGASQNVDSVGEHLKYTLYHPAYKNSTIKYHQSGSFYFINLGQPEKRDGSFHQVFHSAGKPTPPPLPPPPSTPSPCSLCR